jgi:E3 ubiquitin-protein ligase RFWD2
MDEGSTGATVPAVKSDPMNTSDFAWPESAGTTSEDVGPSVELDKELLCPICMQIIKDAFLTACGHSFCYMCIITHLHNKSDCPCCAHYITTNQIFPNFLLDKLLKKTSAYQISRTASPVEQFCQALQKTGL